MTTSREPHDSLHDAAFPHEELSRVCRRVLPQLATANRLSNVGNAAGMVAHQLNNALAPFSIALPLLKERAKDSETMNLIAMMEGSAQRAASLLNDLLTLLHDPQDGGTLVDLADLIGPVERLARHTFPRHITLQTHVQAGAWRVKVRLSAMRHALLSLLLNSRDALNERGAIRVTANGPVALPSDSGRDASTPSTYVRVAVSDTGRGFEHAAHAFEPFYTTKDTYFSIGLGLPVVRSTVEAHAGAVTVDSGGPNGTTVSMYLPLYDVEPRSGG